MVSIRSLLSRIYTSPEKKIYELVLKHAKTCSMAVKSFLESLKCLNGGEECLRMLREVSQYEEAADAIRKEVLELLSVSGIPPLLREDFIRLAERIDMVADWIKAAARVLQVIYPLKISDELKENTLRLAEISYRSVELLYEALTAFGVDYRKALGIIREIEEEEDKGDEVYIETLGVLAKLPPNILYVKLVDGIENSIDACEDASDVLEEIIVRAIG